MRRRTSPLPRVVVTMGDAAGIGPEIVVRALAEPATRETCTPVVLGDARVLRRACDLTGARLALQVVAAADADVEAGAVACVDFADVDARGLRPGVVAAENGRAAVRYTREAARLALAGRVDAIVSAPLNKAAMHAAGLRYGGHTEILAEAAGVSRCAMVLLVDVLRIMLLTNHVSLRQACDLVTRERVVERLELADAGLRRLGIERPRIAVAALNPHAGEEGLFGHEERDVVIPAIAAARERGIEVMGPFPADTVFLKAREGVFDLTLALHHDQGLLPAKLLGFGRLVTLLFGLPFIRTSVGHGTAYDIAWTGCADHRNMVEAIRVAAELAAGPREREEAARRPVRA
jgi:4-hydroxythreonine-4-phosphate dehydrogenase